MALLTPTSPDKNASHHNNQFGEQSAMVKSALETLEKMHRSEVQNLYDEIRDLRTATANGHCITPPAFTPPSRPKGFVALASPATPHLPAVQPPIHAEPGWENLVQKRDDEPRVPRPGPNLKSRTLSLSRMYSFHMSSDRESWSEKFSKDSMTKDSVEGGSKRKSDSSKHTNLTNITQTISECNTVQSTVEEYRRKERAVDASTQMRLKNTTIMEESQQLGMLKSAQTTNFPILTGMVQSQAFELCFAITIVLNSLFLGVQIHVSMLEHSSVEYPTLFKAIEYAFTVLFTLELIMRVSVFGCSVFCDRQNMFWYYLDTFCVVSSFAEMVLDFDGATFRVARNMRLVKLLRVARLVRYVRSLRTLVLSIVHTLRSVAWAFILLLVIIYVFSLVFAQGIANEIQKREHVSNGLTLYWGTLPQTMFTLFKSIASGISWHEVVVALAEVDDFLVVVFILYIAFIIFAFMNVITGIFCEAAIESAKQDQDLMIHQVLRERQKFTTAIRSLFSVGDDNEDFVLSYHEFESVLINPTTKAHLAALELDMADAWELFKLLDTDESALIDVDEFVNGCLRLKGFAKSVDVAKLSYDARSRHKRMAKQISSVDNRLTDIQYAVHSLARQNSNPSVLNQRYT